MAWCLTKFTDWIFCLAKTKVLTCFLLPQSGEAVTTTAAGSPSAGGRSGAARQARSPTHIKFAFDGEAERPGELRRNPTPYPKELKALAKHLAQRPEAVAAKDAKPTERGDCCLCFI